MDILQAAILRREREYSEALDRLSGATEENDDCRPAVWLMREAIELVRCLRRLVPAPPVSALHDAFGAPGDFGYDTPIGDALYAIYRGCQPCNNTGLKDARHSDAICPACEGSGRPMAK